MRDGNTDLCGGITGNIAVIMTQRVARGGGGADRTRGTRKERGTFMWRIFNLFYCNNLQDFGDLSRDI
jgi:hypothetical protein